MREGWPAVIGQDRIKEGIGVADAHNVPLNAIQNTATGCSVADNIVLAEAISAGTTNIIEYGEIGIKTTGVHQLVTGNNCVEHSQFTWFTTIRFVVNTATSFRV